MFRTLLVLPLLAIGLVSHATAATFLDGQDITLRNLYHGSESPGYTVTFTVDSALGMVEVAPWGATALWIDVYDTSSISASILIGATGTIPFGSSPNLIEFEDTDGLIAPFASVVIGSTTVPSLLSSDLTFSADSISLDVGDLTMSAGQTIRLDLFIPEPGSLSALVALAAATLLASRKTAV